MGMGGFVLYSDGNRVCPVVFDEKMGPDSYDFRTSYATERLGFRDVFNANLARTVSENEILDRSKGDPLLILIVLVQLIWFASQIIARGAGRFPITTLEIATVAYVAVFAIIYAVWWKKPRDVRFPIGIRYSNNPAPKETHDELAADSSPNGVSHSRQRPSAFQGMVSLFLRRVTSLQVKQSRHITLEDSSSIMRVGYALRQNWR